MSSDKQEYICRARLLAVEQLLSETKTLTIELEQQNFKVEYLMVPALTEEGNQKPPIFVYPGGGTHLAPCFEHLLYLDRSFIVISPLGYGKSSNMPFPLLKSDPLLGARVALQFLKATRVNEVEIFVHSNAAPIGVKMALASKDYGISIVRITMANPVGLRWISRIFIMLAFPISGLLSRIGSWGYEHPYKILQRAYTSPKHPLSVQKICNDARNLWYELDKSSHPRLLKLLQETRRKRLGIPIILINSSWDWASFHWPWTDSNEQIFRKYIPDDLLNTVCIPGLHNSTLGRQSRRLAKAMSIFI